MLLYYSPLACSLAAHIACREAGLDFDPVRVDLATKRTGAGGDLFSDNPMGQVPTLVLPDGRVLTENVAVLMYLDDRRREGTSGAEPDRYELTRWLAFVATEVHKKVLWPSFAPSSPEAVKAYARESGAGGIGVVASHLEAREYLAGETFTAADAYLFWALALLPHAGIPLDGYPALRRYYKRHRGRPAVDGALTYEKEQFATPFAAA